MKIFYEKDLGQYLDHAKSNLGYEIKNEEKNRLLNMGVGEYTEYLVNKYFLELMIDFDNISVSQREEDIPAERFPNDFNVYTGKSYNKQVITYHIPYSGDEVLLGCIPNPYSLMTYDVNINGQFIEFDIINFRDDTDSIKKEAESRINNIKSNYEKVKANLDSYNNGLKDLATSLVEHRREELKKQTNLLNDLGVPLKKSTDIPETFSASIKAKRIIAKPDVKNKESSQIAPSISENIYKEILKTIYDTGKVMERLPSIYKDRSEEDLRDFIILQLEPRFDGSTTGETFNKSGKTDILVKYEKENIFVAECKFWGGKEVHNSAIDQLLNYLTWRDSKTALVYFVKNKEMSKVLESIEGFTESHSNYIESLESIDRAWFNFKFHINDDPGSEIYLAIQLFHLP